MITRPDRAAGAHDDVRADIRSEGSFPASDPPPAGEPGCDPVAASGATGAAPLRLHRRAARP